MPMRLMVPLTSISIYIRLRSRAGSVRLEQLGQLIGRNGSTEKVSLRFVTIVFPQKLQIFSRFNSLSNHAEVKAPSHVDECFRRRPFHRERSLIRRRNDRSILRALRGSFCILLRLELPVPKLSTDTCTPLSLRVLRMNAVRSGWCIKTLSVDVQLQKRRVQASLAERQRTAHPENPRSETALLRR